MPRTRLDVPSIEHLSVVDEGGRVDQSLEPAIPAAELCRLYRTFLLARRFDERMLRLQRQGRIGTFGPIRGHEAAVLGSIYALRATDWMIPYYREWPAYMWRGWPLENLILYYAGYAEGMRVPDGIHDLPLCIPIASQVPHAVGVACAARYKGEDSVAMVYFGDGASSHGDCQEAMNFAGVFQAPLVFFCLNNQWAISLPRAKQTHARTLAQKAWEAREPLPRFRRYLEAKGVLTAADEAAFEAEVDLEIRAAVERAEARMQADLGDVFDQVYAEPTETLRAQRAELERELAAGADATRG